MRAVVLTSVVVVSLVAAGCGGGSGSGGGTAEEQSYADAIGDSLRRDAAKEQITLTEEESRCAGERLVGVLGVAKLRVAGVTPEDIRADPEVIDPVVDEATAAQQEGLTDAFFDCFDLGRIIAGNFGRHADAEGEPLSDEQLDCIRDNVNSAEPTIRELFARSVLEGDDFAPSLAEGLKLRAAILGDCLTPEDSPQTTLPETSAPASSPQADV